MIQTVSFPGLNLEFQINRVAFELFGIPVYWYGILLATGLFCGMVYAFRNIRRVGLDADRLTDVVMGAVLGGIVGARTYYVIFSWDMYKNDLLSIFNLRKGGIAIYGAIIGGILVGVLLARWKKVRILPALDLAAGGFLIGQAIGRWGNFVNVEAFGDNTTSILGMTGPTIVSYLTRIKAEGGPGTAMIDPMLPVHPTFLYESVWCFIGFLIMAFFVIRHRRFDGEAFLFYLVWYGAERAVVEGLRTDSLWWGNVRVSQALAAVCVVVAGAIWLKIVLDGKKNGFKPLYVNTEEGQQILAGTFYQKKGAAAPAPAEEQNAPAEEPSQEAAQEQSGPEEPVREEPEENKEEEPRP